jgi:hypothetical protein
MAKDKPLTKSDLVAALKETDIATRSDPQQMETRLKDHVHEQLAEFFAGRMQPEMGRLIGETKTGLRSEIQSVKQELKTEIGFVKDEIKGLKADLSDTPSRRELEEPKGWVDGLDPFKLKITWSGRIERRI